MEDITKIINILRYRKRHDLANLLRHSFYILDESSTYGSYYGSTLTTVEIYSSIDRNDKLKALSKEDIGLILDAFCELYPHKPEAPEIYQIHFLVDPESDIPTRASASSRIEEIDFEDIREQLHKCEGKIQQEDFDGAITNARTLVENICLYILHDAKVEYKPDGDLPKLYKMVRQVLNMEPKQYTEKSLKEILSGCIAIVSGLSTARNELSDAHGRSPQNYRRPGKRHAVFAVDVAKAVSEFLYSSYVERRAVVSGKVSGGRTPPQKR